MKWNTYLIEIFGQEKRVYLALTSQLLDGNEKFSMQHLASLRRVCIFIVQYMYQRKLDVLHGNLMRGVVIVTFVCVTCKQMLLLCASGISERTHFHIFTSFKFMSFCLCQAVAHLCRKSQFVELCIKFVILSSMPTLSQN